MNTVHQKDVFPSEYIVEPLLSLLLVVAIIAMISGIMHNPQFVPVDLIAADPQLEPQRHAQEARLKQIDTHFKQAVAMLHARQYEHAITALHRVLQLSPRLVEAHVNMGFALLGLKKSAAAADFFTTASQLSPYQANAYWGLAGALEQMGDLQGALGAMRTYIHLTPNDASHVRQARAALWEWENALKRGPLPPEEQQFLARGERQWVERNSPHKDLPPDHNARAIDLGSGQR